MSVQKREDIKHPVSRKHTYLSYQKLISAQRTNSIIYGNLTPCLPQLAAEKHCLLLSSPSMYLYIIIAQIIFVSDVSILPQIMCYSLNSLRKSTSGCLRLQLPLIAGGLIGLFHFFIIILLISLQFWYRFSAYLIKFSNLTQSENEWYWCGIYLFPDQLYASHICGFCVLNTKIFQNYFRYKQTLQCNLDKTFLSAYSIPNQFSDFNINQTGFSLTFVTSKK